MNLGAHMSIEGGVHRALERGLGIGCSAVQLFVKNNTQWRMRALGGEEAAAFGREKRKLRDGFVIAHSSYLVNLASPDARILAMSRKAFREEVDRTELLGLAGIVMHPGSHRGTGEERGIERIAAELEGILEETPGYRSMILLETTAGQGDTIGHTFAQLERIIGLAGGGGRLGVCFDTCHAFAAGYDLRTARAYERTFEEFDDVIGLDRLRAFHLNDSLRELGSRRDRHTHIGKGMLGLGAFALLVNDRRFLGLPMVLETPKGPDLAEDIENLAVLRGLRKKRPMKKQPRKRAAARKDKGRS